MKFLNSVKETVNLSARDGPVRSGPKTFRTGLGPLLKTERTTEISIILIHVVLRTCFCVFGGSRYC